MEIHSFLLEESIVATTGVEMVNCKDCWQYQDMTYCCLVERYDVNGFVEQLPDMNEKRGGCGCEKFIVSNNVKRLES